MESKSNSLEDKTKLPVTETISRFYQPQRNRKVIRILTVAIYVLSVSMAAIMLSLYYIFIWDPTNKAFLPKSSNCERIIIPEHIAIRLINKSEISAEHFYRNILHAYQSVINYNRSEKDALYIEQKFDLRKNIHFNKNKPEKSVIITRVPLTDDEDDTEEYSSGNHASDKVSSFQLRS